MEKHRFFLGIPYAINNYTCYEGELSIYILSSLFIFLSSFWAMELLVRLKNIINSIYGKNKPSWAVLYENIVVTMSTNVLAKIALHGSVFVFVLVVPLAFRLQLNNLHKH